MNVMRVWCNHIKFNNKLILWVNLYLHHCNWQDTLVCNATKHTAVEWEYPTPWKWHKQWAELCWRKESRKKPVWWWRLWSMIQEIGSSFCFLQKYIFSLCFSICVANLVLSCSVYLWVYILRLSLFSTSSTNKTSKGT